MNSVHIFGRLVRDPEVRLLSSNITVATFTLAVNRQYKKDGQEKADFINCVAWRKTAEIVGQYLAGGKTVLIEGNIQTRNYEDKDGKKVYVTEVIVDRLHLTEPKKNNFYEQQELDMPVSQDEVAKETFNLDSDSENKTSDEILGFVDDDTVLPFDL